MVSEMEIILNAVVLKDALPQCGVRNFDGREERIRLLLVRGRSGSMESRVGG